MWQEKSTRGESRTGSWRDSCSQNVDCLNSESIDRCDSSIRTRGCWCPPTEDLCRDCLLKHGAKNCSSICWRTSPLRCTRRSIATWSGRCTLALAEQSFERQIALIFEGCATARKSKRCPKMNSFANCAICRGSRACGALWWIRRRDAPASIKKSCDMCDKNI